MSTTNSQIDLLAKFLDVASMRHKVIAQNVANVNTPAYRQLEVHFEDLVAKDLAAGNIPNVVAAEPRVVPGKGGAERLDGNNVDIDAEMSRLEKNTLLFRIASQALVAQFSQLRSAITGR